MVCCRHASRRNQSGFSRGLEGIELSKKTWNALVISLRDHSCNAQIFRNQLLALCRCLDCASSPIATIFADKPGRPARIGRHKDFNPTLNVTKSVWQTTDLIISLLVQSPNSLRPARS